MGEIGPAARAFIIGAAIIGSLLYLWAASQMAYPIPG